MTLVYSLVMADLLKETADFQYFVVYALKS